MEVDDDDKSGLPIVSLDYQSLSEDVDSSGNQIERFKPQKSSGDHDAKLRKCMVGKDEPTGNVLAHFVTCKGVGDEWAVRRLVRDLEEFGRGHTIAKTDGEPA